MLKPGWLNRQFEKATEEIKNCPYLTYKEATEDRVVKVSKKGLEKEMVKGKIKK